MSLRYVRQYATLPTLPARGPMPPMVSVIIPIARTNIVTNPSIELATTGYTAVGGSIARSAAWQYHGTYSLAITPSAGTNSDGAFYGSVALTNAQAYAYSCKFKATGAGIGKTYALSIATTGGVDLVVTQFVATGRSQWISGYYLETSSTNRRLYIRKVNHSAADVFYIDGVQIEAINTGELVSTYIDGDQVGLLVGQQPPAYLWTGTPHASASMRSALTRAGGYVVNLSLYNFLLTGLIGLGMAVPNNISVPYTVLDGARYLRTTKPPRTITLTGRWQSDDPREQFVMASDMRQAFDRDLVPLQQPLKLIVEPQDECGNAIGDFAQIQCIYAGGLDGNDGNLPTEDITPTFTMYVPYLVGGDGGAALSAQLSVANANAIAMRSATGLWSAVGTGVSGGTTQVRAIARGLDGTVYVGGNFTDAGGSGADFLAAYNPTTGAWSTVGGATAINGEVDALAVGPDGRLYVGGLFTNAGGNASADSIAVWDPVALTWGNLSTGTAGQILALAFSPTGILYAGGNFGSIGASAADNIASWNGTAWSNLASDTALNAPCESLAWGNGVLYVGGAFTNANGNANADFIATWNGTAWGALSTGLNLDALAIAVGANGIVYVGGSFTTAGGISVNRIAAWNGTAWTPLANGLNNNVRSLSTAPDGTLYASGAFTASGSLTLPDAFARWNGSAWLPADVDLPSSVVVYAVRAFLDGTVFVGFDATGSATAAAITSVTNDTPGYVWPVVTINGPTSGTSRIYQIVNYTAGVPVYLNLTLSPGEVATLDFNPQAPSFTTTFQGDISSLILPGSRPAQFYLVPGVNSISFFAASNTVVPIVNWQKRYNGVADLVN